MGEKKYVNWFVGKEECTEGKGSGYCTSPVILGLEIVNTPPSHNARRNRRVDRAQVQRGQPLLLLKELPRVMGRRRKRRKYCCLHHVLRRDFRQSSGQLENPNIHIQKWHMLCSFCPGKELSAQPVRPIYLETSGHKRCKTWERMMTRKTTEAV